MKYDGGRPGDKRQRVEGEGKRRERQMGARERGKWVE